MLDMHENSETQKLTELSFLHQTTDYDYIYDGIIQKCKYDHIQQKSPHCGDPTLSSVLETQKMKEKKLMNYQSDCTRGSWLCIMFRFAGKPPWKPEYWNQETKISFIPQMTDYDYI